MIDIDGAVETRGCEMIKTTGDQGKGAEGRLVDTDMRSIQREVREYRKKNVIGEGKQAGHGGSGGDRYGRVTVRKIGLRGWARG